MSTHSTKSSEGGQAFLEFAIIVPILSLILMVTIECGRMFHQYMLLSNIAATAVRTGIQLAGLSEGCFESTYESAQGQELPRFKNLGFYSQQPSAAHLHAHWFAQRRAHMLLDEQSDKILIQGSTPGNLPDMNSEYLRETSADGTSAGCASVLAVPEDERVGFRNTFSLRLEGIYQPLIFPVSLPFRVESRASYLFQNSNFPLAGGIPCRPTGPG